MYVSLKIQQIVKKSVTLIYFLMQVADFGLSIKKKGTGIERMMSGTCGTLIYMGTSPPFFHITLTVISVTKLTPYVSPCIRLSLALPSKTTYLGSILP